MITQGPFDLTLNTALPLNDPGANSNNPATAVQIQNASPFIVEVNAGGVVLTIQSFTAQTLPTSGGGQQMSATPVGSGPSGQTTAPKSLTVVWLLAGESSPMVDGPLTAAAISTTLAQSGIAGAVLACASTNIGAGNTQSMNAGLPTNTKLRLWDWGIYTPVAGGGAIPPTKGQAALFLAGSGSTSIQDAVSPQAPASSRLAGIVFDTDFLTSIFNGTDQTVTAFIDYSLA